MANLNSPGDRYEYREVFADAAVDIDEKIQKPFTLIDVVVNCETAPTTSESLTIKTVTKDGDETLECSEDLSVGGVDDHIGGNSGQTSFVYRFDKSFIGERTIKLDYANTADHADDITVIIQYQKDNLVTGSVYDS